ncbi:Oidioi.mRNA.OKI2018_I69.chr2.g4962.t1.cds [Oikopleura dioica]|uniref:Oidioi.mRNA.OKI2018_I69.chr2.g4962.t1.cds n=1 Tax=Oikopleura dioica TaxID=34765 RepID=A0ABN7SYW9_OIKDI|nr:Oidioi.mRNA.OKI2018_I69.chr2.g4962.t1.cds [Oikopleura dioica]
MTKCEKNGQVCQWKCEETEIGARCICPPGYWQFQDTCHDENECFGRSPCGEKSSNCLNLHGRSECLPELECPDDFRLISYSRNSYPAGCEQIQGTGKNCTDEFFCQFWRIRQQSGELLNYPSPRDQLVARVESSETFGRGSRYSYEILEVVDRDGNQAYDSAAIFIKQRSERVGRAEIHFLGKPAFEGPGVSRRIKLKYTGSKLYRGISKTMRVELIEILVYVSEFDF